MNTENLHSSFSSPHAPEAIRWACQSITLAGWALVPESWGWSVETPNGWVACGTLGELCNTAKTADQTRLAS